MPPESLTRNLRAGQKAHALLPCPMDLIEKIRTLPTQPGVYLYKKPRVTSSTWARAKNLRSRGSGSICLRPRRPTPETVASLMREAVDIDYILVANEHRGPSPSKTTLIKQKKTALQHPCCATIQSTPTSSHAGRPTIAWVFVTRCRLGQDGLRLLRPLFSPAISPTALPSSIHRSFLIPSCKVDLNRHPSACLPGVLHSPLPGPLRRRPPPRPRPTKEVVRDASSSFLKASRPNWSAPLYPTHDGRR